MCIGKIFVSTKKFSVTWLSAVSRYQKFTFSENIVSISIRLSIFLTTRFSPSWSFSILEFRNKFSRTYLQNFRLSISLFPFWFTLWVIFLSWSCSYIYFTIRLSLCITVVIFSFLFLQNLLEYPLYLHLLYSLFL